MPRQNNNALKAAADEITNILTSTARYLMLYIGMYRYVTLLSWATDTSDDIRDNVSAADVQYLISMLLKAIQSGDQKAINQFDIDFNRLCSATTDTSSCTIGSPLARKNQVLGDFLAATSALPIENARAVIAQLNQSVGNHALNVVAAKLMQDGEWNYGILQEQMQARLYQNGPTFGLYYEIPMYTIRDDSEDKISDKRVIACLEINIKPNGELAASHNICLQDTTQFEYKGLPFLPFFTGTNPQSTQGTPCNVTIEDVTDAECNDWATVDLKI